MHYILLFSLGSWIEDNVFSILSFLIMLLGAAVWLIRLESNVKQLMNTISKVEETLTETSRNFHDHVADPGIHNSKAHIQAMKESLSKLETRVDTMYANLDKKLDRLNDFIMRGKD